MDYVSKVQIGNGEEVDIKDANAIHDGDLHNATQSAAGLMSAADKTKLDGISPGAQVNPGNATQSAAGLMSAADKTKLDGITAGARPYTAGAGISISNGVISVSYGNAALVEF